jgi:broad specificity phosphatase PhoE
VLHTHLILVCHALTDAQRTGRFPAPEDGLRNPAGLSKYPGAPAACLSAPEWRARHTAERWGLMPEVDPGLRDCRLGEWAGVPLKKVQRDQPGALEAWQADVHIAPPGGESVAELCQRVAAWLEGFARPGRWIAVTHPMVIRAAMLHVLGAPPMSFYTIDVQPLAQIRLSHSGRWRLQLTEPYPGDAASPALS